MKKFDKSKSSSNLIYPQGDDITNCVIYCYMNLFNKSDVFSDYIKDKGGHDMQEEFAMINKTVSRLIDVRDKRLFQYPVASNSGTTVDGLTYYQVNNALNSFDSNIFDAGNKFIPLHVSVSSRKYVRGQHRIIILFDGDLFNMTLIDPQMDNFIYLSDVSDLVDFYSTIIDMEVISFLGDVGVNVIYFDKEYLNHLPFKK